MNSNVQRFEVELESDMETGAFSRVLATLVNGSPAFLARVVVGGTIVYPPPSGSLYAEVTVRLCEFRTRDSRTTLDPKTVAAILQRIEARFPLPTGQAIRARNDASECQDFIAATATKSPAGSTVTLLKPARSA